MQYVWNSSGCSSMNPFMSSVLFVVVHMVIVSGFVNAMFYLLFIFSGLHFGQVNCGLSFSVTQSSLFDT